MVTTTSVRVSVLAAFGLGCATALALTQQAGGSQRIPQFENDHVRVWKSVIVPKQPLTMHRHDHPRAVIALKGGALTIVKESGTSRRVEWESGRAYWFEADPPGERHADLNETDSAIEVIVVEVKSARSPAAAHAAPRRGS